MLHTYDQNFDVKVRPIPTTRQRMGLGWPVFCDLAGGRELVGGTKGQAAVRQLGNVDRCRAEAQRAAAVRTPQSLHTPCNTW